ncbi:MAG: hypothetical protein CMJ54_02650, partial [Planctomycetaceae bacterium]|nr:hypothetical protein [Planctomycetaceae bacterium]
AGGTEYGGFCGFLLSDSTAEGYISCGGDYYGSLSDIGFPDLQPYIVLNGSAAGDSDCEADFDQNGFVRSPDLGRLLGAWSATGEDAIPYDLDEDGIVGPSDLGILITKWGPCP